MRSLRRPKAFFELIDRATVEANWNGIGATLATGQNLVMPQTANGSMIFAWVNQSTTNNAGQISITSGGSGPEFFNAPALSAQPLILIHNWRANNLSVTNISFNQNTPIWISAFGPGAPGQTSQPLPMDGTPVSLATGQNAAGDTLPQNMQLVLRSNTPTLCIFGVIGGPTDAGGNNGRAVAVNAANDTGPGTGVAPPDGYYATTTANSLAMIINWGGSRAYAVNMSPATAAGAQVLIRPL